MIENTVDNSPFELSVIICAINHNCWLNVDNGGDFNRNGPV